MKKTHLPLEKWEILLEALGSSRGPEEVCLRHGVTLVELRQWLSLAREGALARLDPGQPGPFSSSAPGRTAEVGVPPVRTNLERATEAGTTASSAAVPETQRPDSTAPILTGPLAAAPILTGPLAAAPILTGPLAVAPILTGPLGTDPTSSGPACSLESGAGGETDNLELRAMESTVTTEQIDALFSMVSHELKEPARGIRSLCQFMEEDYADLLPARGLSYLKMMAESSARMHSLIEGLSEYARVGRRLDMRHLVPLAPMLEQVRNGMDSFLTQRQATVMIDSRLPTVQGDPTLLAQTFKHLITNAVKFNVSPNPRVEILCLEPEHPNAPCSLLIKDNGIGIPERQWEHVFDLFLRLHRYEEYPGAGVGLAVARRIVRAHGGSLVVQDSSEEGTTLRMSLPLSHGKRC